MNNKGPQSKMMVRIRATVAKVEGDEVLLEFPAKEIHPSENEMLERLFPHTMPEIENALATEAVLGNILR